MSIVSNFIIISNVSIVYYINVPINKKRKGSLARVTSRISTMLEPVTSAIFQVSSLAMVFSELMERYFNSILFVNLFRTPGSTAVLRQISSTSIS